MRDPEPLVLGYFIIGPSGIGLAGDTYLDFDLQPSGSIVEDGGEWGTGSRVLQKFDPPLDMDGWDGLAIHIEHGEAENFPMRFKVVGVRDEGEVEWEYDPSFVDSLPTIVVLDTAGASGIVSFEMIGDRPFELDRFQRAEYAAPDLSPLVGSGTVVDDVDDPVFWSISTRFGPSPIGAGFHPTWEINEVVASGTTFSPGDVLAIERDYGGTPLDFSEAKLLVLEAFGPRGGSGTFIVRLEAPDGRSIQYESEDCGQGFRTLLFPLADAWENETLDEVKIITVGVSGVIGGPHIMGLRRIAAGNFNDLPAVEREHYGLPPVTDSFVEFEGMNTAGEWTIVERMGSGDSGSTSVYGGGSILFDSTFVGVESGIEEGEYGIEKTYSPPIDLRQSNTLRVEARVSVSGTTSRLRLELVDEYGAEIRTAYRAVSGSYEPLDFDIELAAGFAGLHAVEKIRIIVDPTAPLADEESLMVLDRLFPGIPIVTDEETSGVEVRSIKKSEARNYEAGWHWIGA